MATVSDAFHALFRALEQGDERAFDDLWVVDDPSITRFGLEDLRGRELRFDWVELEVHERTEVAWANAHGRAVVDGDERSLRVTGVLVHNYAGWRWHTLHLST